MKKKILVCLALLQFFMFPSIAIVTRMEGTAGAIYLGTKENINPIQELNLLKSRCPVLLGDCEKLSKIENFLICRALDEYDFKDNEVYKILVQETNSPIFLVAIVVIINNGNSLEYWAFYAK